MAITNINGHVFVPRADWGARRHQGGGTLSRGLREVNIHHTVTEPSDDPCVDMRHIENVLHQRGLAPGYSYVIHPSGIILEGAGKRSGAHTAGRNKLSYGISFIGNFDRDQPTAAALSAAVTVINLLRFSGELDPTLSRLAFKMHRDHNATACPGLHLAEMPGLDGKKHSISSVLRFLVGAS